MKNKRMIWNRELALNIAEDVAGLVAIGILFFAGLGLPYVV